MIERIKENFRDGIYRIKWFASVFAERLKIEIAVVKLLYRSDELEKNKNELLMTIGRRVYELKENPDKNILKDKEVAESLSAIEMLEKDIDEVKQRVSEMSGVRS